MRTVSEIVDALLGGGLTASPTPTKALNAVNYAIKEIVGIRNDFDLREYRFEGRSVNGRINFPIPKDFSQMRFVQYDSDPNKPVYNKPPGASRAHYRNYWYQSGYSLVFSGNFMHYIDIAYYRVTPTYAYCEPNKRKLRTAKFNADCVYEYRDSIESDDWVPLDLTIPSHRTTFDKHANVFVREHAEVILMGAEAFLHNSVGQLDRGGRQATAFLGSLERVIRPKYRAYLSPEM